MAKAINLENGNTIPFTAGQLQQMKSLYLAGSSIRQLSEKFGISCGAVVGRLKAMGVRIRPRGQRCKSSVLDAEAVIKMRADGVAWKSIARTAGRAARTLQDAVKRYQSAANV